MSAYRSHEFLSFYLIMAHKKPQGNRTRILRMPVMAQQPNQ